MADTVADLTSPLDVRVAGQQFADANGEPRSDARLWTIRDIEEDENGATLRFLQGGHGRLAKGDPAYPTFLQLARRAQARQHPVGVRFAEGHAIAELIRADNDVPAQWLDDGPDRARVLFEGHDGVFFVPTNHPDFARLRTAIADAIQKKSRVWLIVRKPQLMLADVVPAETT